MGLLYYLFYHIGKFVARIFYRYRVVHAERLDRFPQGQGVLLASNHVSYVDPPLIGNAFDYPIYFLARKSLWSNPIAAYIYDHLQAIPVDQGKPEFGSLKRIIRLAKQGEKVVIFPEGERSLTGEMAKGLPGIGLIIAKSQVPVIPVRIFGAYEALPRGASFPRPSRITVVIGEPVQFTEGELKARDKEAYTALSQRVMDEIAKLELVENHG